jgi:uncharacterized protein YjbI with pentapeptide repeats
MNLTVKIPFIAGWGKPDLSIEIDASIETRFHLRAAVTQAVSQGANLDGANLDGANLTRANLYGANLYGANLTRANLYGANLDGANLTRANLYGANLTRANLYGANLYGANLDGANLDGANLYGANLDGANLDGANLYGANLDGANLDGAKDVAPLALAQLSIVPEAGAFEGFKQLRNGAIAHLLIPATAKRSNATGRKCRASQAKVLAVWDCEGKPIKTGQSKHDSDFAYRVGRIVKPDGFSENRFQECAPGIHFFLTRIEAANY